jgi:hypothetical protein
MVYVILAKETGRIKIGHTEGEPVERLRNLQTGSSEALELLVVMEGTRATEAALHRQLRSSRLRGEWFNPTEEVLAALGEARASSLAPAARRRLWAL